MRFPAELRHYLKQIKYLLISKFGLLKWNTLRDNHVTDPWRGDFNEITFLVAE